MIVDPGWYTSDRLPATIMNRPGLAEVFAALAEAGSGPDGAAPEDRKTGQTALLVGGAVRNALLGVPADDIDLATPLHPQTVVERLAAAGLRSVPTGLDHGTVTAIAKGNGFEVTTLRSDVSTDGRRATVRFSEDLTEDAGRRDFTINALYADAAGRVIDPLGGRVDLSARRLRFIGDPEQRIREDYLRILRFFRFQAWYGAAAEGVDAEGLAACAALADGIDTLARERIGHEMRRLLAAPDPAPATAAMAASGVLARCLPGASAAVLAPLAHLEAQAGRRPDWRIRLAAMAPMVESKVLADRLRLARAEERHLAAIAAAAAEPDLSAAAFRHGADAAWGAWLAREAAGGWADHPPDPDAAGAAIARGAEARLPLSARDLSTAGIAPGPALGAALAKAEARFVESGFALDKSALLTYALEASTAEPD
ncbi:MAG: CCA tRNA nucleotidyltransferase [Pseudomonadota bacterium]